MTSWLSRLPWLVPIVGVCYLALGALSFWPDGFWAFETLSNLRVFFVWSGLLLAVVLLLLHFRGGAILVAVAAIVHAHRRAHAARSRRDACHGYAELARHVDQYRL